MGKTPYFDEYGKKYDSYADYLTVSRIRGVIPGVPDFNAAEFITSKNNTDIQDGDYKDYSEVDPYSGQGKRVYLNPGSVSDSKVDNHEQSSSENDNYKETISEDSDSQITDTYGLKKWNINPAALVKPVTAIASAIFNLNQLKKTRDAALNIRPPKVLAATTAIRPIQSLPPEIKELYIKNLAGMQTKKTSDETSNRISEGMLAATKMTALDKLTGAEVENLFKERQRHDQAEAINAQENVKALNEEAKYSAEIYNKQADIKAGYESAKAETINRLVEEGIIKPVAARIEHNLGVETIRNSEEWNRLQTMIINKQNALHNDPRNKTLKTELEGLIDEQKLLYKRTLPSYDAATSYMFKNYK